MEDAIVHLRNNRIPRNDVILNEYLKWGGEKLIEIIPLIFNKIITTEDIPEQWHSSSIILIHKKGNREDLNNYRPISLLPNLYKLFMKILTNRITKIMDENQPPDQAGFRTNYSTIDHLQTVNQVIEKAHEFNLNIYMAFIDFSKAFDSVEHISVLEAMKAIGVQPKYVRIIGKIYLKSNARVRSELEGEIFRMKRGVRQGDPISPKLFTCVLEMVFRKLNWSEQNFGDQYQW